MNETLQYSLISKEKKCQLFNYVEKKFFGQKGIEITSDIIRSLEKINYSYNLMEKLFKKISRENGDDYFEHLRDVAYIVLNELENPTINKVIIALLHDSIEDIKEIDFNFLKKVFGVNIAISVQAISKKPWQSYLKKEEIEEYNKDGDSDIKSKGKEFRNEDYYGHMESFKEMKSHINNIAIENGIILNKKEIIEITKNTLFIKFADRIHNLRTQWDRNNLDKVNRKIEETEEYFLKIAKDISPKSYNILKSLIFRLIAKLISLKVNIYCIK